MALRFNKRIINSIYIVESNYPTFILQAFNFSFKKNAYYLTEKYDELSIWQLIEFRKIKMSPEG